MVRGAVGLRSAALDGVVGGAGGGFRVRGCGVCGVGAGGAGGGGTAFDAAARSAAAFAAAAWSAVAFAGDELVDALATGAGELVVSVTGWTGGARAPPDSNKARPTSAAPLARLRLGRRAHFK